MCQARPCAKPAAAKPAAAKPQPTPAMCHRRGWLAVVNPGRVPSVGLLPQPCALAGVGWLWRTPLCAIGGVSRQPARRTGAAPATGLPAPADASAYCQPHCSHLHHWCWGGPPRGPIVGTLMVLSAQRRADDGVRAEGRWPSVGPTMGLELKVGGRPSPAGRDADQVEAGAGRLACEIRLRRASRRAQNDSVRPAAATARPVTPLLVSESSRPSSPPMTQESWCSVSEAAKVDERTSLGISRCTIESSASLTSVWPTAALNATMMAAHKPKNAAHRVVTVALNPSMTKTMS